MFSAQLYLPVFHHGMLAFMLLTALVYSQGPSREGFALGFNALMIWGMTVLLAFFIGTRPVDAVFVDMATYAASFNMAQGTGRQFFEGDWAFNALTSLCAEMTTQEVYFFVCACLYIIPLAIGMRIIHGQWALAAFAALIGGFSFYSYGVNGIRNGIATSLLILAFSLKDRKVLMLGLMAWAVGTHKSVLLPAIAFLATGLYAQPWIYWCIWGGCLLASSYFGEGTANFLTSILPTSQEERLGNYVSNAGFGGDKGGFRIDFVFYSIVPLILALAMSGKSTRKDPLFRRLVCTYLLANSFWLLTMYAAFSNRFAYLSWFMMPWVIIYPFIPRTSPMGFPDVEGNDSKSPALLGAALIANFAFTYIMMMFVYQGRVG